MPFVSLNVFSPLMTQRVSIAPRASDDVYGQASYGAAVSYQCAVVGEQRMVQTDNGREVPSSQSVYLMSNAPIRPEDQITLSTGDAGSTESFALHPRIVAVSRYPFLSGQFVTCLALSRGTVAGSQG